MRIEVAPGVAFDDAEVTISFIQAGGPGGQNVNKVATAAQIRFDAGASASLPEPVKLRLRALAGSRCTRDGVIVITARRFRSQERNRQEAMDRLIELIAQAARIPVKRRPTRASYGERQRRLAAKSHRATTKRDRGFRHEE